MNLSVALTAAFIVSCSQQQEGDKITAGIMNAPEMEYVKSEPTVINISKIEEMEQTDFDGLIKSVKYIPLDNREIIGEISDVIIENKRMYILDSSSKKIFIYDLDGKLIKCINTRGHANNEFLLPFAIFFQNKELVVKDAQQLKILHYDKNGKFLKVNKSIASVYGASIKNYIINQLSKGQSFDNDVNYHLVSSVADSVCYKGFKYEPIQLDYLESDRLRYNYNRELLFQPSLSDTIYNIKSASQYSAKYVLKHKNSIWKKSKEKLSFDETIKLLRQGYTEVNHFFEVDKYLIMSISFYDKELKSLCDHYLIYDKEHKIASFVKDPEENFITNIFPLSLNSTSGNICVSSFNPFKFKYSMTKNKNLRVVNKELSNLIMQSTENSNPIVVLYTFK